MHGDNEKTARGRLLLFLHLLEHFALSGRWIVLLELKLAVHLLFVLAREEYVPGGALQLYEIYL